MILSPDAKAEFVLLHVNPGAMEFDAFGLQAQTLLGAGCLGKQNFSA